MDVAVIGAGAAGLAASLTLRSGGAQVTLYERGVRPGGRMCTHTIDGARVDVGVQLVSSSYTETFALSRATGAGELLRRSPGRDALWRKERANPITYGSVTSMASSGALPTMLKLKMAGRYLPFLTTQARTLDANDPAATGGVAHDAESIGAWGTRELGSDFVELLAYPLLAAYYGSTPEETSAAVYHALARAGMDVSVYGAAGGFGALAEAWLAAFETGGGRYVAAADVTAVESTSSGVRVTTGAGSFDHDALVVAVPPRRAAHLLSGGEVGMWLARVRSNPTFSVAYRMDREYPGDYFGLSFPRGDRIGDRVVALCIQSRKLPGLVPPGGDALVALPAPLAVPGLIEMDDAVIARSVLETLELAVRGIGRRVLSSHVFRFDDGYTIFATGHLEHISRFDEAWLPRGVRLAGDYLVAPTVEGAVVSGIRAARSILGVK